MEITEVRVRKVQEDSKMKAIVSVTFDNEFVVHDIKIIDGNTGLFVAMPSRRMADGEFRDIAHPINGEMRNKVEKAIFSEYERYLEEVYVPGESNENEEELVEEIEE